MVVEFKVPSVGESITQVTVSDWLKGEGETVQQDENLAVLETDKVTVELPAPVTGTVVEILAGPGETVSVGAVIARIEEGQAAPPAGGGKKPGGTPVDGGGGPPCLRRGRRGTAGHARRPAPPRREGSGAAGGGGHRSRGTTPQGGRDAPPTGPLRRRPWKRPRRGTRRWCP